MGKRFHSQRGATTIGGVGRRRSMRGMIDSKVNGSADIRPVNYELPVGRGGAMVSNPGSGERYYVSNPMGQTFKPGATVPAGSYSGGPIEFLLVGPPAGPKGASLGGSVRRGSYRTGVAPPVDTPNFIAVAWAGIDNAIACYYLDGTYLSTIATSSEFTVFSSSTSVALVGGRYVVALSDRGTEDGYIRSWDLQTGTVSSYQVPTGYIVDWTPAESGGFLYWVEAESDVRNEYPNFKQYFRLVKSDLDLANSSVVSTIEASVVLGVNGHGYGPGLAALNSTAMVGFGIFSNQDGMFDQRVNYRFPLSGGAATTSYTSTPGNELRDDCLYGRGVPDSTGKSVLYSGAGFSGGTYDVTAMRSVADTLSLTTADLWPTSAPYPTDPVNDDQTLHIYADGITGLLYFNGVAYIAPIDGSAGDLVTVSPSAPPGGYDIPRGFFPIE